MIAAIGATLAFSPLAMAQASAPSALLDQYRSARASWLSAVTTATRQLFGALALLDFACSGAGLLLENAGLPPSSAGMLRQPMWTGASSALFIRGPRRNP